MITRDQWREYRRKQLADIEHDIANAERRQRIIEEKIDIAADDPAGVPDELRRQLNDSEMELDSLNDSYEAVYNETFEMARGDAEYDTWKARRDDEHLKGG